ncbi:MAG: outer membrane beta-barrel protein, partial [Owenweeksia sp.]
MKKIKVILFLFCFIAGAKINAQNLRLGVHATPSVNYISTSDPDVETDLAVKFGFGLMADYYFAQHYAISTGVDILSSGGTMMFNDTSRKYHAGYVQIPIALKMSTREFGYFTYFARFGGGLLIKTSESIDFEPN